MNKPVSYPISELLKEKEYDIENPDNLFVNYYLVGYYNDGREKLTKGVVNNKQSDKIVLAPTIADVVMWLYEKYGIWIYAKGGYGWEFVIELADNSSKILYNDGTCKSPEEAYEAAFEHTLINLI